MIPTSDGLNKTSGTENRSVSIDNICQNAIKDKNRIKCKLKRHQWRLNNAMNKIRVINWKQRKFNVEKYLNQVS